MVGTYTTTQSRSTLIEMFLDGTSGEVYCQGRLATVETDEGNRVQLVAYGNEVIAEITRDGKDVTLFTGHHESVSETVSDYIEVLGSILNDFENREVTAIGDAAPTMGIGARSSASAQYISQYINWTTTLSPVERKAQKEVNAALKKRMAQIFG
jgi:hypothetical protein